MSRSDVRSDRAAVQADLMALADRKKASDLQWFFKTGPGEYGEGDRFRGVTMPKIRQVVRRHSDLPLRSVRSLLKSPYHEDRMAALLILVAQYQKGNVHARQVLYETYLSNTDFVNNWDLVDASAQQIVGTHLAGRGKQKLVELANSESLWERRIAIIATLAFIRAGDYSWTFRISRRFLVDREDLIHKATGWMLREVGKRDVEALESFLAKYYARMPLTMLRYAIEKLPEVRRKQYLAGAI
jgi:3-methyladenine DNA glycosylase AlkD